ncbi:MAG: hypothetical protein J5629_01815 [Muribaculaceae bacterium]|nr:hypothetical protein [Muribaculaceae bacterium]
MTRPEFAAPTAGLAHGRYTCCRYGFLLCFLPSLSQRGTIAAQVLTCCHNDTRASCVSVGYRHGGHHLLTA